MQSSITPSVPAWTYPAVLALVAVVGLVAIAGQRSVDSAATRVAHTHEVRRAVEVLRAAMRDLALAERIAGRGDDARVIPGLEDTVARIGAHVDDLGALVSDNPEQVARVQALRRAAGPRLAHVVDLLAVGASAPAPERARTGDAVPRLLAAIEAEEARLLEQRLRAAGYARAAGFGAIVAVCALAVVLLLALRRSYAQALARSRESEARLQRIVAEMPVMLDAFDEDGRIVAWNRECERVTGYRAEEIVGNPAALELLYPDPAYRERMLADWRARADDYQGWEWTVTARDGVRRTIAWSNIAARAPIAGWASWGIGVDVTELRDAERQLRERTRELESVLDTAPTGIWFTADPEGRVLKGNRHAADLLGVALDANHWFGALENERIEVRLDGVVLAPEDLPAQRAATHGESVDRLTYELRRGDGRVQWLMCSARPIVGDDGLRRGICAAVDVTARVLAERSLAESERRFRTLADSLPQIVWAADPDGRVEWYNRRWHERVGAATDAADGWLQYVHPDDRARPLAEWPVALATGSPFEVELRLQFPGRAPRWHLARAVPVKDADGRVTRWVGTSTDVDELRGAQDALRLADRRKDEMVATIAHELRGPLAPVRLAATMLGRASVGSADVERCREIILRQTQQMSLLLDDLLDTAQVARGSLVLRKGPTTLGELCRSAVEIVRPQLDARRHTLEVDVPDGSSPLHGDVLRLTQVLANLLTNAAKYTDPGGRIRLAARRDGDAVRIAVSDDGIGLAPEALERVFEMFSQEGPARSRADGGLGIGLALVRGLVELHGGSVAAASDGPGCGSTFTVVLPIEAANAARRLESPGLPPANVGPPVGRAAATWVDA